MKKSRNYRLVRTACLWSDTLQYRTKKRGQIKPIYNIIQVQQAAPTSAPTQVPVTTPQPFVAEELPTEDTLPAAVTTFQGVLTTLYYIFAVLAVISAVLLAASIAGRVMNRPKDGQEQLQLSERHNYTEEVPEDERVMIADDPS